MGDIFNEVLNMSLDALWLIIAIIIVRAVLRKSPKYFRKILWGLVGIRLLIPISLESMFSLVPQEVSTVSQNVSQQVADVSKQATEFSLLQTVPYVWSAVAAVFLLYGIVSFVKLRYKISDAVLHENNVFLSEKVDSPFVCGFLKPRIYIPYGLDDNTKECILNHERTHIKHGDHFLKAIGFILLCVHWFNPLVWVSYFLFCKDIELACDESVVKNYDYEKRKKYAQALFDLGINKVKFSACPVAFGEVGIKERVKNALNYKKAKRVFLFVSFVICVAVAVCFMTEPKVQAKEQEIDKAVVEETTTEPVTERTTEPITESTTEVASTESVEQQPVDVTELSTEYYIETNPTYDQEFQNEVEFDKDAMIDEFNRIQQYELYGENSLYTQLEQTTTDPMYEQAKDAGVFMDDTEGEVFWDNAIFDFANQ